MSSDSPPALPCPDAVTTARWPGKSNPGGPPHPAFWHMLDVAAVAADVFAHRLVISGDETGHAYVSEILEQVAVPG